MTDIIDFLNNVTNKDYAKAESQFASLINGRLNDRLQNEKVKVAGTVFNNVIEEDPEPEVEAEQEPEEEVESNEDV
tara:strand:+ start:70 stop:297 length:228 start_codon:yes stop_codon:yes gene_type:complete